MARKSKNQRNAEQRVRQQKVRDDATEVCRPSRDDIARMLLWKTISDAHKSGEAGPPFLKEIADDIVDGLVRLGFDGQESYDVFDSLVRKYADGLFPFRPKPHLGRAAHKQSS